MGQGSFGAGFADASFGYCQSDERIVKYGGMLMLICGEDTFRAREYLRKAVLRFKSKFDQHGRNITVFSDNVSVGEAGSAISSLPFLTERRLVIFENIIDKLSEEAGTEKLFENVPESTICVIYEEKSEPELKKNALAAALLRAKDLKKYVYSPLPPAELEKWIQQKGKSLGLSFGRGAARELAARIGPDLWQMAGELEKFAALGAEITAEWVRAEIRGAVSENIFNFVDAVAERNAARALAELDALRQAGAYVGYLMTMIYRQIRMLLAARSWFDANADASAGELAAEMKWHPFAAKKILAQARAFSLPVLRNALSMLFRTAMDQRFGIMDEKSGFDLFVAKFILSARSESFGQQKISAGSRGFHE